MGVDVSGLSRSERGVGFIDVVGVGAGQWQSWVHLPVNVIRRGRNVRSRAPATELRCECQGSQFSQQPENGMSQRSERLPKQIEVG